MSTAECVIALARALTSAALSDVQLRTFWDEGLPLDALLLDLLAPTACHLGQLWEEDEADFVDVTIALGRLQGLARTLCAHLEVERGSNGRRILLTPCRGETHLLNLVLVASFFREAGWSVIVSSGADEDPADSVRNERFDLIGVSLSSDALLPNMVEMIAEMRAASCNPMVRVLVGGPSFLRDPTRAVIVGADATAVDGRSAVQVAESMFAK